MKKISSLLMMLLGCCCLNAQTIYTTPQNYQFLKQNGKLNPKAIYNFIPGPEPTGSAAAKIQEPDMTPVNGVASTSAAGSCACLVPVDPTFSIVPMAAGNAPNYRNDDGFSSSIPLGFNFCFYGTTYTSCFINTNGNITFNSGLFSFSAGGFPAGNSSNLDTIMIAPFWADVDTRGAANGLVYYKQTPTALIVKWNNVGYFNANLDKRNDFQLIITNGTDPLLPNGSNVAFCYGDMQWTTGDASQGANGFGGVPATVGVNKGDRTNYVQIGRFDQAGFSYDGPYGANDGVTFLTNKSYFFNTCGTNNNLPPIIQDATGGGSACGDTIRICAAGDTLVYTTSFLAPENNQTITVNGSAPSLGGNFMPLGVTTTTAGITTYAWMVVASPTITGVHTVIVTGTDNGAPPLSSSATYYIKIENIPIPQPTISVLPSTGTVCATPGATVTLTNCADYNNVYWSNGSSGCSILANTSGVYYVTVNKLGCYKSSSDTITVFPNPVPVISGILSYCPPATSTTVSAQPLSGSMPAFATYTWSPGAIHTPTASFSTGVKTVTVTDVNGCKGSASFTITASSPSVTLSSPDLIICPGDCSKIKATGTSSFTPFTYAWSNSSVYTGDSTLACSGGPISVIFTDARGCVATKTITVIADVVPVASFVSTPPSPVSPGDLITFNSTSTIPSGSITSTSWFFGDGNGANGNPVDHTYLTVGSYPVALVVTGSNGCKDTTYSNYVVEAVLVIPNIITPNGDNVNDYLKFRNLDHFNSNNLTIFNRWGTKIFEQENYKNDWGGGGYSDGTYFFILSVPEASPNIYKGNLQLVR